MQDNRPNEIYAAAISFTLAIIGIMTNGAAIAIIACSKHLQNAFGYACMSHAIGDVGVLLIFATWISFGSEEISRKRKTQEIRYFIQSVCSETALVLTFLCFWCVAVQATTPLSMFVLNIGAWESMHTIDGFIMTAFNHHIFTRIKKSAKELPSNGDNCYVSSKQKNL
ncbi:hypothetical protein DINM_022699 [Dirofilaria immitis]|nr:hypothetical protein [Dirofilaria immitis]